MVYRGASHNFVIRELVISLGLSVTNTTKYKLSLGNSSEYVSQGVCKALKVKVGRYMILVDGYVLELIELILGVEWLETHGRNILDLENKNMIFAKNVATSLQSNMEIYESNSTTFEAILATKETRQNRKTILEWLCPWKS
ncbi:hypothetical protein CR513_34278, partial [Mucuna pruriens]